MNYFKAKNYYSSFLISNFRFHFVYHFDYVLLFLDGLLVLFQERGGTSSELHKPLLVLFILEVHPPSFLQVFQRPEHFLVKSNRLFPLAVHRIELAISSFRGR